MTSVLKPEYIYRPKQLIRRLGFRAALGRPMVDVVLPWGASLRVRPAKSVVGRAVLAMGVFDLLVSEVLWRLSEPTDVAVDVGANVGYMTSLMAARAESVHAYEPHPDTFEELTYNINNNMIPGRHRPVAHRAAVSDRPGELVVVTPDGFETNCAIAGVSECDPSLAGPRTPAVTLDGEFGGGSIGILKIDVEGHELNVVRGGSRLFAAGSVRACVFESHDPYPTPVTAFFEEHGYTIFGLVKGFFGPVLADPTDRRMHSTWESRSLLATREVVRAKAKLAPSGWQCLRGRV